MRPIAFDPICPEDIGTGEGRFYKKYRVAIDMTRGVIHVLLPGRYWAICRIENPETDAGAMVCFAIAPQGQTLLSVSNMKEWQANEEQCGRFGSVASKYGSIAARRHPEEWKAFVLRSKEVAQNSPFPERIWETKKGNISLRIKGVIYPYPRAYPDGIQLFARPITKAEDPEHVTTDEEIISMEEWARTYALLFPRTERIVPPSKRRHRHENPDQLPIGIGLSENSSESPEPKTHQ